MVTNPVIFFFLRVVGILLTMPKTRRQKSKWKSWPYPLIKKMPACLPTKKDRCKVAGTKSTYPYVSSSVPDNQQPWKIKKPRDSHKLFVLRSPLLWVLSRTISFAFTPIPCYHKPVEKICQWISNQNWAQLECILRTGVRLGSCDARWWLDEWIFLWEWWSQW